VIIVTDLTAAIQYRKVLLLGLDGVIDGIITSEGSGSDKPAQITFQLAVDRVSEAGKGTIWMIGDNPESDLRGAKQGVGAVTLQKIHAGVERASDSAIVDATFESFADLRELLQGLSNPSAVDQPMIQHTTTAHAVR
jgi:putative hydrolase of the HAD superfamily